MTEADPIAMLASVRGRASDRRLRLVGIACCRRVWGLLPEEFRSAVAVAERFADGLATRRQLGAAKRACGAALASAARPAEVYRACASAWAATRNAATAAAYPLGLFTAAGDRRHQAAVLRDIFGTPSRPTPPDPGRVPQNAIALAQTMYDSRDFTALPLLADLLEEVGCPHEVSEHCRGQGPHVRGCWVVDLILGKR